MACFLQFSAQGKNRDKMFVGRRKKAERNNKGAASEDEHMTNVITFGI